MNQLIAFFSRQHTFVNIVTFFVILVGAYSTFTIKRETFPNVTFDVVTVTTVYPNASAETVESLITNPLESDLREVDGVKEITSVSSEGRSVISITLDPDQVDVDEGEADVEDVVDAFSDLPEEAEDPLVVSSSSNSSLLLEMALGGDLSPEELRSSAKHLKRELELIDGISKISYKGFPDYEFRVEAQPERMRRYKVSLNDLVSALRTANVNVPGGSLVVSGEKTQEFVIKTRLEVEDAIGIENVILRSNVAEEFIRVKDVAKVQLQFAEEDVLYRTDQQRGINFLVRKKSSADAINVANELKATVASVTQKIHPNLKATYVDDASVVVDRRVTVLSNNLLVGLVLVLIILSIMLPFRVALVAAVGIPFSFLATLLIFDYGEISLNLISMMGLIIVIGMLVDDAIVVTENAQRKMDEGMDPETAAIEGTQEIWTPVATSVTTTFAAFLPLMFMSGIFGKFLQNLPIGVLLALAISLFECFFILPSHVASWVKKVDPNKKTFHSRVTQFWSAKVSPFYERLVRRCLRMRYIIGPAAFLFAAISIWFAATQMSFKLFPGTEDYNFTLRFETPVGTPIEETEKVVANLEAGVTQIMGEDYDSIVSTVGLHAQSGPDSSNESRGSQYAEIKGYLLPTTQDFDGIMIRVEEFTRQAEGISDITIERGRSGPPVGKAVSVQIIGENYDRLLAAANGIKKELATIEGVRGIADTYTDGKDEIIVKIDEERLSLAGVSRRDVADAVLATFDGIVVDSVQKLDEEIDIRVTYPESTKNSISTISQTRVPNRADELIAISNLATIERQSTRGALSHLDGLRLLRVEAEVTGSMTSAQANKIMKERISQFEEKFPDLRFAFGGEDQDRLESFVDLGKTFVFAMIGILLLLMLQFNNFYQPFIIACIVPLGLLSVIWAFYLHGEPLSFLSTIGMIALAGVVINNAIVFIDFTNNARKKGLPIHEAIIQAALFRLRPIFLTTVTTVAGILPTAYGIGGRDDFVVPVALSLGWGMLFGSVLTLMVLPVIIALMDEFIGLLRRIFRLNKAEDSPGN